MERAYKFSLEPTKTQAVHMEKTFGCIRFVYNHFQASLVVHH